MKPVFLIGSSHFSCIAKLFVWIFSIFAELFVWIFSIFAELFVWKILFLYLYCLNFNQLSLYAISQLSRLLDKHDMDFNSLK